MRVSLELVPRNADELSAELRLVKNRFPSINTINLPDLARFELRSWEAAGLSKASYGASIPHIRAMDFKADEPFALIDVLDRHAITEVLVVTGDAPGDGRLPAGGATCTGLIAKLKREHPQLKVYAAIDPYRDSMRGEYEYVRRKIDAGADGFFTQPFFDSRLMELYADMLEGTDIFWGVAPVVTDKSRGYWEKRNRVVFPNHFEPTLAWNLDFSRQAIEFARQRKGHIYFMPIKVDLTAYLEGVFNEVTV
ncbi:methylenetetrahydrofolate reductase [Paenibacillus arenilitoris]|uniref:methylenetetrahydrofolate reductase n=1 Tax=Paenibacillus arenilitoris TaxID=2772299 RepID=UPI001CC24885|nr:methylenetetrahydrofolate reductase [Paenibacillus arenilitoris]